MFVAGVVAEYNPFHNGHKYQLEETRKKGATHIVVVMSGSAVQRGEVAVYNKFERADTAISNGADLVIELPAPFSCSNGEIFAKSAVSVLAGLGENIVNGISFGCECSDINVLEKCADLSIQMADCSDVLKYKSQGLTYPQAVAQAVLDNCNENISDIFSYPNNTLAIEYLKAKRKAAPWIRPIPIERKGAWHDSSVTSGNISSATNIRKLIYNKEDISDFLPEFKSNPHFIKYCDREVLLKLMTASFDDVMSLPDVNENIANRFFDTVNSSPESAEDFIMKMKSKNITLARLRRLVLHLVLGVKKTDISAVPYGRILAFNERGREILSLAETRTLNFDTSLKKLEKTSDFAKRISFLEQNSVRFQDMCVKNKPVFSNEYTHKIILSK